VQLNHPVCFLFLATAALLPRNANAQAADSVAFHQGQWGAEFRLSGGFFGVGALRFSSPTRALLIDVSSDYNHISGSGAAASSSAVGVFVDLGMRAHHAYGRRLYRLITFGVSLGYSRQTTSTNNTKLEAFGAGPFADLGATWLVTPHLGIGAKWRAAISYTHATLSDVINSAKIDQLNFSLGNIALEGQLYF
jgi:hypothetical protein